jgi:phosphoglycerate dehydrogenase-like enzyme
VTITVLVPNETGVAALAGVDGVEAIQYEPGKPLPPGGEKATVLVPGFLSGTDATKLLDDLPDLDFVQLLSAGAENWIPRMPAGVKLSICRGAHGGSTAEWVIGALLYIYREFGPFAQAQDEGKWVHDWVTSGGGTDTLQGKRVLIVGAGDLGEQLVRRLDTFDTTSTLVGRRARDGVRGLDELPQLLGDYDVVVLMVPLTTETTGMVDAAFLARMADNAILVNAARGPVVDTDALVAELNSGRLRAALDVTDPEPLPEGHPLWTAKGLFLTPHVGGSCRGSDERSWKVAAAEIARYAAGEELKNLVHGEY